MLGKHRSTINRRNLTHRQYMTEVSFVSFSTLLRSFIIHVIDKRTSSIRLHGSGMNSDGLLQFRCDPEEDWMTLDTDNHWTRAEGSVVCRQLGFDRLIETDTVSPNFPDAAFEVINVAFNCNLSGISVETTNLLDCEYIDLYLSNVTKRSKFVWVSCGIGEILCFNYRSLICMFKYFVW